MPQYDYRSIRAKNLAAVGIRGFHVSDNLPPGPREENASLRRPEEIAGRLFALNALFCYVAVPRRIAPSRSIKENLHLNSLKDWMTDSERSIISSWRWIAHYKHVDLIGWYLENMLSLAWVLGFETPPGLDGAMVGGDLRDRLLFDFVGTQPVAIPQWIQNQRIRPEAEVIEMEDLFYCAHNAVRNAQFNNSPAPHNFDPIANGGVIHERRHALTWAISPGVSWDETDLST